MENPIYHYFIGGIVGMSQTVVGHPLDTLKTIKQYNKGFGDFHNQNLVNKFNYLYRGIRYPLYISSAFNFGVFGLLNNLQKYTNNYYISGFITGGLMAVPLNPFELYKVRSQVNYNNKITSTKNNLFCGTKLTVLRESFGSSIYFGSYFWLKNNNIVDTFTAGGVAGVASWTISYPFDTIRTKYMINPDISIKNIFINTIKERTLWNGFSYCILRAYIVNAVGFTIYDYLHKIL